MRSVHFRRAERRTARLRAGGSPRILVIGICQGQAVAEAMGLLLPEADLTYLPAFDLAKRIPRMSDLIAMAKDHDVVFSNSYLPPFRDGGTMETLREAARVVMIPTVIFAAFHPDQVYVSLAGKAAADSLLLGPMGHSHSALALFGYLEGLDPASTFRLFDEQVYRRLGYFAMWEPAVEALRARGREADYDFDADLLRWSRRGCFMHGDNHPKMFVAADLARGLLAKAGIDYTPCDLDSYLPDFLLNAGGWPVYPAIARHYGVPGNELFLKVRTPKTGPARTMTLVHFLEACFARYARHPREALACERVDGWRRDPEIREMLIEAAHR